METSRLVVEGIEVIVIRKAMKSIRLGVRLPDGIVRIAVPRRMTDDAIRLAILSKLSWIRKHQDKFAGLPREQRQEFQTGESHLLRGTLFPLTVMERPGRNVLSVRDGSRLELSVKPGTPRLKRKQIFLQWYRNELESDIPPLICKWEKIIGVRVHTWGVKRMQTRWGSCNPRAGRIWLTLELAKRPIQCLEYVIVHEMVHLLERGHTARFKAYMSEFLPEWKTLRKELQRLPMSGRDDG